VSHAPDLGSCRLASLTAAGWSRQNNIVGSLEIDQVFVPGDLCCLDVGNVGVDLATSELVHDAASTREHNEPGQEGQERTDATERRRAGTDSHDAEDERHRDDHEHCAHAGHQGRELPAGLLTATGGGEQTRWKFSALMAGVGAMLMVIPMAFILGIVRVGTGSTTLGGIGAFLTFLAGFIVFASGRSVVNEFRRRKIYSDVAHIQAAQITGDEDLVDLEAADDVVLAAPAGGGEAG